MNKHNDSFEQQLNKHFNERKQRTRLNEKQHKQLHEKINKPRKKMHFFVQMASVACALGVFAFMVFNTNTHTNTKTYITQNSVDIYDYHFIEIHKVDNSGHYLSEIKRQKQQLDNQLANNLRLHQQRYIEYGQLVKVDNDWYIANCNDEVLVQIKRSLLDDLKIKHAVQNNISSGDMLAMTHNSKGQIIALKHANESIKHCNT
jgi:hypothetical protein